ncbi:MAG: hypothetical protein U0736_12930 [Gemmataceae bacterium]
MAGALTHFAGGEARAYPPDAGGVPPAVTAPTSGGQYGKVHARSRLMQARVQLAQGDFEGAEAVATEVARQKLSWSTVEDSPAKLQKDIAKSRTDPQQLLLGARTSLARKDYARAEQYARQADRLKGFFTFPVWGDSPSKVLHDVETARKTVPVATRKPQAAPVMTAKDKTPAPAPRSGIVQAGFSTPAKSTTDNLTLPPTKTAAEPATPPRLPEAVTKSDAPPASPRSGLFGSKSNESDEARALVKLARQAIAAGKLDDAKKYAAQARTKKANLSWWEDNPDRVDTDLRRLQSDRKETTTARADTAPKAGTTAPKPTTTAAKPTAPAARAARSAASCCWSTAASSWPPARSTRRPRPLSASRR